MPLHLAPVLARAIASGSDYHGSLYPYDPVKPLPIIFAVLIFVLGWVSYWQNMIYYRWMRFGFTMFFASTIWTAGFVVLALSEWNPTKIAPYIVQYVLVLIGPPAFGAAETFILGRIMAYLPYHASLHPGRVVTTFILLSAVVEAVSAAGASRLSASRKAPELLSSGADMMNAALLLQCCVELLFLTLTAQVHHKARKAGTLPRHVLVMIGATYTTSTMMLARCIFRVVQGFQIKACLTRTSGGCGATVTTETLFWIFDVANITLFVIAWVAFPPGKYLPHSDRVFLDPTDGVTERFGPGFSQEDPRPWLVTACDPFNFYGKITGSDKKTTMVPFWEEQWPLHVGDKHRPVATRQSGEQVQVETAKASEAQSQPMSA